MPNLRINNKTYSDITEVHIPLTDGSGNEDFAYIMSGSKSITANGTHDVKHYGTVNVNVPTGGGGITPTGTKTITANGTYDVTEYASANVAVPSKDPTIRSLSITANGTYTAPSGVDGYSPISVNVPTGGGGIDTSDATATADDIEEGKTAYVNGVKVTGTLSELDMIAADNVSDFRATMNCYIVASQSPRKGMVQAGGIVGLKTAPSLFGNCKPEDVRQGVTFTSENGLRKAGTLVVSSGGGGGLPGYITALASEKYTPPENKTSRVDVRHGLGVTPNFCVVMVEEDFSAAPGTAMLVGATVFGKKAKYSNSNSTVNTVHITMEGYNTSSSIAGSVTRAASDSYFTDTTFGIPCNGTYPLKSGYTYRWVCGVMEGIQ